MSTAPKVTDDLETQPSPPASPDVTEPTAPSAGAEPSETKLDESAGDGDKSPTKLERRMHELTKRARLAEARAETLESLLLKQGGAPADKSAPGPTADEPKPKPKPEDFETTELYLDARDEWVREDTLRATREDRQKAEKEQAQQAEQAEIYDGFQERIEAAKEKNPDFGKVTAAAMKAMQELQSEQHALGNVNAVRAIAAIAHTLPLLDAGEQVLFYLGQHPDELEALSELHPTRVVAALGRIEERLAIENKGDEENPSPQPRLPKPPTPIRTTSKTDDGSLRDELPMKEWQERFRKKMEKK